MAKQEQQTSHIGVDANGQMVSFVGPDAVELFRVATLASAMGLYKAGIRYPGTMTGAEALKDASRYTGVTYKRGEYDKAKADLKIWIETMKSAIPTVPA